MGSSQNAVREAVFNESLIIKMAVRLHFVDSFAVECVKPMLTTIKRDTLVPFEADRKSVVDQLVELKPLYIQCCCCCCREERGALSYLVK